MTQLITEPTNFAETSSTIIDLILVSNLRTVELSGVGEPFLMQDIRYHCPTYCVLKFKKHLAKAFSCKIWLFENGDYNAFRQAVSDYDWNTVIKEDVNFYANALTQTLINLSEQTEYIPNKNVTIRPQDLPWINSNIRKLMRKEIDFIGNTKNLKLSKITVNSKK